MFNFIGRQSSAAHFRVFKERFQNDLENREELLRHVAVQLRALSADAGVGSPEFVNELRKKFGEDALLEAFLINLEGRIPKAAAKVLCTNLLNQGHEMKKVLGTTPMFFSNNYIAAYLQMVGQSPSLAALQNGSAAGGDRKSHSILKSIRDFTISMFEGRENDLLSDRLLEDINRQAKEAGFA